MGKVIAIANQKGQVGKTTTAINLAVCLAEAGQKVLLIDTDARAGATQALGLEYAGSKRETLYELLTGKAEIETTIHDTHFSGLKFIPSDINLVEVELKFLNVPGRNMILRKALEPVRHKYDFILIDCAPSLGIVTTNALVAADSVIIPIHPEMYPVDGIGKILQTIRIIQDSEQNPNLGIEGFLITMYEKHTVTQSQIVAEIRDLFKEMVFTTTILYDPQTNGAESYRKLSGEVIAKAFKNEN